MGKEDEAGGVGVLVAEMLGIPSVTTIVDFSCDGSRATCKRELEGGVKAGVGVALPALFTCQLGLNTVRYPTLPNIMKAKKKELLSIDAQTLAAPEPRQQTQSVFFPEKSGSGLLLEGEVDDLVNQLIAILKEKTGVLA